MNDKQQLAAMGEHLAEQQPMCMAKRIEELEGQKKRAIDCMCAMASLITSRFQLEDAAGAHHSDIIMDRICSFIMGDMASAKDIDRLDFLDRCVMSGGVIEARRDRDPYVKSKTFGYLNTVGLFTVPSQHVRGVGLRGAIDAAMLAAAPSPDGTK